MRIKTTSPDGTVRVQAWECTKPGHPGMYVYTQSIALDKMAAGFNIQITAIDRHPDGSRTYSTGVLVR